MLLFAWVMIDEGIGESFYRAMAVLVAAGPCAPAMAPATVGIAMGAAGSDVALETADVALMGDDLTRLLFVIGLIRGANRSIRQDLWFSLGMVAVLVPTTLFGLQPGAAVMFHEGSTLLVVTKDLRLLAYRDSTEM